MVVVKFRKRTATTNIVILIKDTCCVSYHGYYKQCRRMGDIDAGVHYFVDTDGTIHVGRDEAAVAGWRLEGHETSLYILAQSNNKKLNSSQKLVLEPLLEKLKQKYKDAKVIERTE